MASAPKPLTGKKILIADDEELVRVLLKEELESVGAKVLEASGGRKAFEMFEKTRFDAVITDVRMPEGDGLELLTKIRAAPPAAGRAEAAVILLTAFPSPDVRQAAEQGHAIVVPKPYLLEGLVEKLVLQLGQKRRE